MKEKYLFLDIDGVLNDQKSFKFYLRLKNKEIDEKQFFSKIKVMPCQHYENNDILNVDHVYIPYLNKLKSFVSQYKINVVGISSWFITYDLKEISEFMGIDFVGNIANCGGSASLRTAGILEFLKNKNIKCQNVDFVIFDDDQRYNSSHHVLINNGVDEKSIIEAKKILKIK